MRVLGDRSRGVERGEHLSRVRIGRFSSPFCKGSSE